MQHKGRVSFLVFLLILLMLTSSGNLSAQEWKRYQEIQDATGNQFAVYLRVNEKNDANELISNPFCGGSLVHVQVVVTAAHCIWGIYGDPNSALTYSGGEVWIQEPGKHKSDVTAKRVKGLKIFHPETLGKLKNWTNGAQDDIAFIVLEEPIVKSVPYKFATKEQLEFAVQNKLSAFMYGYGFNSVAEHNAYYSILQENRYSIESIMNPHKIEYKVLADPLPEYYKHHVGLPKMLLLKAGDNCPATVSSGSPATIVINGEELLVGPGSHSTGWACTELPNYSTESQQFGFQYRNVTSHISIAYFQDLMNEAISFAASVAERKANELKAQQEAVRAAAELKSKQEAEEKALAEAQAAADLKAKQEADAKAAADKLVAAKAAAQKKTTITCVKGKLTKKVTAVTPKCPSAYKKR
jgi:hypothetical protein